MIEKDRGGGFSIGEIENARNYILGQFPPTLESLAAKQLMPAGDFVLVVVGKADEIREQLARFGTFTEKKISDPDF